LKREYYEKEDSFIDMKTEKEIYQLKKELLETLKAADTPYYGLSLENLTVVN
jgi:hypothetical protein